MTFNVVCSPIVDHRFGRFDFQLLADLAADCLMLAALTDGYCVLAAFADGYCMLAALTDGYCVLAAVCCALSLSTFYWARNRLVLLKLLSVWS